MAILIASLMTVPASASRQWSDCTEVGEGPAPEFAGKFRAAYDGATSEGVDLGAPVSGPRGCVNRWAQTWTQKFFGPLGETNLILNEDKEEVFRVFGDWLTRYIDKGGPTVMGVPTDNATRRGEGTEQHYNGGDVGNAAMYRRDGQPIFIVQGAIQQEYHRLGGTSSPWGFPVSDEVPIDGPVNLVGGLSNSEGLARSNFENGSLIYHCKSVELGPFPFSGCEVSPIDIDFPWPYPIYIIA